MAIDDENSLAYRGWRVVAASALALAFGPSTIAVLGMGLFMRPLQASFGWPRTDVALATTIVSWMIVVVSPLQGWLADRFGVRRVMLPSIVAFALGIAALSLLPPSRPIYYAAWVIIPVLGVGLFPLSYLKAVSSWFGARLGLALGVANAGVALGGILVPLVAGWLIAAYGWRTAYVGLGLISAVVALPAVGFFVRERPADPSRPAAQALTGAEFGEALRTPTFGLLALGFLLVGIINTAIIVHQVPLLIDGGMAPAKAAAVQSVFGVFGLLGRLFTGLLLDRMRAPLVMALFTLGGAVACALYALGAGGDVAFLCSALIGLMFGAEFDVLAYMIKARFGMRAFGKIYGAIFAVFQLGAGFGAAFLPILHDRFGGYGPGLWTFAALLVASAVCVASIRHMPRLAAASPA